MDKKLCEIKLAILQIKQIKKAFKTIVDYSFLDHETEKLESYNAYDFLSV